MNAEDWSTKMRNKKSLEHDTLLLVIVSVTIIIIMLLFSSNLGDAILNALNKNVCKSSVYAQDMGTIKNIALPSDIKCPMQKIEIKSKTADGISREFADYYYKVCDEFGQGTLNLFGKRETTFCVIRDKISFNKKGIVIEDFNQYLEETNIPGKDVSYNQFCSGFKTKRGTEIFDGDDLEKLEDFSINTDKEYVILFVYVKGEEELREFMKVAFGTSASHIGQYVGTALIVGGGALMYTGKGAIVGLPLRIAGRVLLVGGLDIAGVSGIINWLTNEDVGMEWASFFLIREFNEEELKKLPCEYMPAEQSENRNNLY